MDGSSGAAATCQNGVSAGFRGCASSCHPGSIFKQSDGDCPGREEELPHVRESIRRQTTPPTCRAKCRNQIHELLSRLSTECEMLFTREAALTEEIAALRCLQVVGSGWEPAEERQPLGVVPTMLPSGWRSTGLQTEVPEKNGLQTQYPLTRLMDEQTKLLEKPVGNVQEGKPVNILDCLPKFGSCDDGSAEPTHPAANGAKLEDVKEEIEATDTDFLADILNSDVENNIAFERSPVDWQELDLGGDDTFTAHGYKQYPGCPGALTEHTDLWPIWEKAPKAKFGLSAALSFDASTYSADAGRRSLAHAVANRYGTEIRSTAFVQHLMVHPNSRRMLTWQLLSIAFISYDLIFLPLQAFISQDATLANFDLATLAFWGVDMVVSFIVGYHTELAVEMRPVKVAKRYMTTWFPFDLFLIMMDLAVMDIQVNIFGMLRIVRTIRIVRVMRLLRLLRLAKLLTALVELNDFVTSEWLVTVVSVMSKVVALCLVSHFIACGWFALAQAPLPADVPSWTTASTAPFPQTEDEWPYWYTTALHWSLTQFTPASMEVSPKNAYERSFAIVIILFALVVFSSLISSITASMTHLRLKNAEQLREREFTRRFLQENMVSLELSASINRFLRLRSGMKKARVLERDVSGFAELPELMLARLRVEVHSPLLVPLPVFHFVALADSHVVMQICVHAMSQMAMVAEEDLFLPRSHATEVLFIRSGLFHYSSVVGCDMEAKEGDVACDMVLWLKWVHVGRFWAQQQSEITSLNAAKFHEIVQELPVHRNLAFYARAYSRLLKRKFDVLDGLRSVHGSRSVESGELLTDLWMERDLLEELAQRAFAEISPAEKGRRDNKVPHAFRPFSTLMGGK